MKDEITFLGTIKDEKYGELAHFYSNKKGNYFCRIIKVDDIIIYDELPLLIQKEILLKFNGDSYEN